MADSSTAGSAASKSTVTSGAQAQSRRRSSNANNPLFASLVDQKRGNIDAAGAARRASYAEQRPAPGFIGSMWNAFTKGSEHGGGR